MISAPSDLSTLQERIGVGFRDESLLRMALTHSSYTNEHPDEETGTNERLEFLGDAVLGLVVAETLYEQFPGEGEGRLTEWRAQLVMGVTLARIAEALELGDALRLGHGEEATGGRHRERNLERTYEAIVGAVMIDRGLESAREFVHRTLAAEFSSLGGDPALFNPKGTLQQLTQGEHGRPEYVTAAEHGPEHAREFTVEVRIDGRIVGRGRGASKQLAEKSAAREALDTIQREASSASSDGGSDATRAEE